MQSVDLRSAAFPHTVKAVFPVVQMAKNDDRPVREKGFFSLPPLYMSSNDLHDRKIWVKNDC